MRHKCACKVKSCHMHTELAYGVTPETITIGIRADNATLMQSYLTYGQALRLAGELRSMVRAKKLAKALLEAQS